jgi:hypothetical protein
MSETTQTAQTTADVIAQATAAQKSAQSEKAVAGVRASAADSKRRPAAKPAARKSTPARKTAPAPTSRVKTAPADSNSTITVLNYTRAVRDALSATPASKKFNADVIKILSEQIKRSMRAGTESTPAQLAKHAAVATTAELSDYATSARKSARSK